MKIFFDPLRNNYIHCSVDWHVLANSIDNNWPLLNKLESLLIQSENLHFQFNQQQCYGQNDLI